MTRNYALKFYQKESLTLFKEKPLLWVSLSNYILLIIFPAKIYLFKANNRNTRKTLNIFHIYSSVSIVDFEQEILAGLLQIK